MKVELSVIIVNYNGQKFFKECLDSLYEKLAGIVFEIIVLDNNSSDGSCAYIKSDFPKVILIESSTNHGFGKGNNEAVRHAKGDYLLLINNDTIVVDELKPVLDYLKLDKNVGVVGINMLNGAGNYLPAAGNFPNVSNLFQMKKFLEISEEFKTAKFSKTSYEVDWLGGSFLMMPKAIYDRIGGFDEDYFMYVEDVDLCKKIADSGYKRIFLPQYSYIHFVGFSKAKNPMLVKGIEIYISKHHKSFDKLLLLSVLKINKFVKKLKNAIGKE